MTALGEVLHLDRTVKQVEKNTPLVHQVPYSRITYTAEEGITFLFEHLADDFKNG